MIAVVVAIFQLLSILLLLGTLIYIAWKLVLKMFIKNVKKRKIAILIGTILAIPLIYVALTTSLYMGLSYYPNRDFDQKEWFEDHNKRYELSSDIIRSKMLIGKTKAEVRRILGNGGHKDEHNRWGYLLGITPGLSIDPEVLYIDFENGKVVKVEQHKN